MSHYFVGTTGLGNKIYYEQFDLNKSNIKVHKVVIKTCTIQNEDEKDYKKHWTGFKTFSNWGTISIARNRKEISKEEFFAKVL